MTDSQFFYRNLPKLSLSLTDLLGMEDLFSKVPEDWHVVVLDIENSTQAVNNGFHQEVNLTATGGIIAVLNRLKNMSSAVKALYFFGGDGATFLIHDSILEEVLKVLENYHHHVKKSMELNLKVGSFPVQKVYESERTIRIAKFKVSPYLTLPIVLGTGLKYAEAAIKSQFVDTNQNPELIQPVNLEGMECRWQEVEPPYDEEQIICLLVNCSDDALQGIVFQSIVLKINEIFGTYEERQPISSLKLKLDTTTQKIKKEMYA